VRSMPTPLMCIYWTPSDPFAVVSGSPRVPEPADAGNVELSRTPHTCPHLKLPCLSRRCNRAFHDKDTSVFCQRSITKTRGPVHEHGRVETARADAPRIAARDKSGASTGSRTALRRAFDERSRSFYSSYRKTIRAKKCFCHPHGELLSAWDMAAADTIAGPLKRVRSDCGSEDEDGAAQA